MLSNELKERIRGFYKIEHVGSGLLLNGKRIPRQQTVFLGFGVADTKEKATEVQVRDLYKAFFPEFEDRDLMDERSEKYLAACKRNIGFFDVNCGWDSDFRKGDVPAKVYNIPSGITGHLRFEIKEMEPGKYVAQTGYRVSIDDYNIDRYYFDHVPKESEIVEAALITQIEWYLWHGADKAKFECWECGRTIHWLDIEGSLKDKWEGLQEQYCGC